MGVMKMTLALKHDELLVRDRIRSSGQRIRSRFVVRYLRGTTFVVNVALQEVTATIEGRDRRGFVPAPDICSSGASK